MYYCCMSLGEDLPLVCPATNFQEECKLRICRLRLQRGSNGRYPLEDIHLSGISQPPDVTATAEGTYCYNEVQNALLDRPELLESQELALDARSLAERIRLKKDALGSDLGAKT